MPSSSISDSVSQRICKHMNKDHHAAVLAYAKHYGGAKEAIKAKMLRIDPKGMDLEADGKVLTIPFDHLLNDSEDAHRTLVAMLKNLPKEA